MLHLLEVLPVLGNYVIGPALTLVGFTVNTGQFILGID